ncbi:MAG: hypothetical protein B7Z73_09670, partial [Planctomycetia bacterium 21-64-5]
MRFTVEWQATARENLADLWLAATAESCRQITSSSQDIDVALRHQPYSVGESRTDGRRILFARPLAVVYEIHDEAALVKVVAVWRLVMEFKSLLSAISFAARAHEGQFRKDGETPYIAHPLRVMTVASQLFGVSDLEALMAAVLHDTIEDTRTDHDDLSEQFGTRVADYVAALTKDKRLPEETR